MGDEIFDFFFGVVPARLGIAVLIQIKPCVFEEIHRIEEGGSLKQHPHVLFAGQICGVEGYVESIATGLMAGLHAAALATGAQPIAPPRATAFGSLTHYITHADPAKFQPANITFDLLPPLDQKVRDRQERHRLQCQLALKHFDGWVEKSRPTPALR